MQRPYTFIANWKMQLSFEQTLNFCKENYEKFINIASNHEKNIILCPSYPMLHAVSQQFKGTPIALGSQDCSAHRYGAHTGDVAADTLAEIGCAYCIIGHSERRGYHKETNDMIIHKLEQLLDAHINPIICVGETAEQHKNGKTIEVLTKELEDIWPLLEKYSETTLTAKIAYEPIWAIGTGVVPTNNDLMTVFSWLHSMCKKNLPALDHKLIYGGSVNEKNIHDLKAITHIDGFLIGGASLDFQKFEKIVS